MAWIIIPPYLLGRMFNWLRETRSVTEELGEEAGEEVTIWQGRFFYRCGIPPLFSRCSELTAHITKIAAIAAENKKVRGGDPVAAHRGSDNMESVTHAL